MRLKTRKALNPLAKNPPLPRAGSRPKTTRIGIRSKPGSGVKRKASRPIALSIANVPGSAEDAVAVRGALAAVVANDPVAGSAREDGTARNKGARALAGQKADRKVGLKGDRKAGLKVAVTNVGKNVRKVDDRKLLRTVPAAKSTHPNVRRDHSLRKLTTSVPD
jgi:hypothetical protein